MIQLLRLALRSLWHRRFPTTLTVLSLAAAFALLMGLEKVKRGAEEGFTQSISQVDLIVGARGNPLQLLLYTVFNVGQPANNVPYEIFEKYLKHPSVEWAVPYSVGDSHRGYRVIGTTPEFFSRYRFRSSQKVEWSAGQEFRDIWDVVIGSEVERELKYAIGSSVVITHGVSKGLGVQHHDQNPFRVSGILKPTGTPIDRSVYIALEAHEALHEEFKDHGKNHGSAKIDEITAFLLRTKNRIETLGLQREINTDRQEPLTAVIPGVALGELWQNMAILQNVLRAIGWLVLVVSLMIMLLALTLILNERRREMAILRSLGAHTSQILFLMIFESLILSVSGVLLGWMSTQGVLLALQPHIEAEFGMSLSSAWFEFSDFKVACLGVALGLLVGLYPAQKAIRAALKDGLVIK